jgi:hypothetical protein
VRDAEGACRRSDQREDRSDSGARSSPTPNPDGIALSPSASSRFARVRGHAQKSLMRLPGSCGWSTGRKA